MTENYVDWPIDKLEKEVVKIRKIIETKKKTSKKAALAKVIAVAKQNGFELSELLDGVPGKTTASSVAGKSVKKRAKVKPKYKNPENEDEKWSGRGRQPLWVKDHLTGGGNLNDLLI